MSEFNFDKLKNHEIPDSWVSGALDVPPEKEKSPVIFSKAPKMIAFAATFVVVCALSVTLFIFTQKGAILPLNNETQGKVETTIETNTITEPTEDTKLNTVETTAPTKPTEAVKEPVEESQNEVENSNPSIAPTTPNTPTTKPNTPTTKPSSPTDDPNSSNPNSTEKPTNPNTTNPSGKPNGDANKKPNGGSASSTPSGSVDNKIIRCNATITINEYLADTEIFCKIFSPDMGNLGGGGTDKFPPRAAVEFSNGFVNLKYELDNKNGELEPGVYEYYFYNAKGDILSYGMVTVY